MPQNSPFRKHTSVVTVARERRKILSFTACVTVLLYPRHTRCVQNTIVIFKFRELRMLNFLSYWYTCLLYMLLISAILDCQFGFDRLEG